MSRFDMARRGRILAWTGAALAWGTAVTIAGMEPENAEAKAATVSTQGSMSVAMPASQRAAMPNPPAQGLMILRYQPSGDSAPDVRTVYVRQEASQVPAGPRQQPAPAPAPRSSGS